METAEVLTMAAIAVYVVMCMIVIAAEGWVMPKITARRRLLLGVIWPLYFLSTLCKGLKYMGQDSCEFLKACVLNK